ncbi:tRNA wybutosine-synthesizing protein [Colletotrichum orchidophilum]|uniref:tRNA wybutosine-synthesizing protein 2 n=1 Tax=Colletotrichum orchidophilum TaxID=1209926 RepID=A0A1G4ATM7_9PEZI|nr:tRNA wybutosine-synthesizing protein [Colletotrichum orchidophilum]OHE92529.1 tRNA wybutosine-synthesizing protein [Colletotrichum orchidophilum]
MTDRKEKPRGKKPKPENPISAATRAWLLSVPPQTQPWNSPDELETLLNQHTPKRFTVYEPMLLLPSGSFNKGLWRTLLNHPDISEDEIHRLWDAILRDVSKTGSTTLTHLAVNEGIPLQTITDADGVIADKSENILRTPSGLKILHGDFGPSSNPANPSPEDFEGAFWVSTKQNGIHQTWAPRWTMFSRGNIKEKTRLLDFHSQAGPDTLPHRRQLPAAALRSYWAVDLYAGIGYFTFSYAKLGLRVLCWELNPWSVEALRRGAVANGWRVKVVQREEDLRLPAADLLTGDEQITIFLQDNQEAGARIADMRASGTAVDILHVNGGLLPTSEPTWRPAWDITTPAENDCWLHLHENVGVHEIEPRRAQIQRLFDGWAATAEGGGRAATVEHVELVKTYAPDVWHCVFDVHITRSSSVT